MSFTNRRDLISNRIVLFLNHENTVITLAIHYWDQFNNYHSDIRIERAESKN